MNDQEELAAQARIHFAFEQMILSVLAGALAGGGAILAFGLGGVLFGNVFTFIGLLSIVIETIFISFTIFLAGFFSSVVLGAPLFLMLEKAKRRTAWPYLAAALGIAIVVSLFISLGAPMPGRYGLKAVSATFLPAIVIALTFARRMRPYWRAREQAEESAASIIKLH